MITASRTIGVFILLIGLVIIPNFYSCNEAEKDISLTPNNVTNDNVFPENCLLNTNDSCYVDDENICISANMSNGSNLKNGNYYIKIWGTKCNNEFYVCYYERHIDLGLDDDLLSLFGTTLYAGNYSIEIYAECSDNKCYSGTRNDLIRGWSSNDNIFYVALSQCIRRENPFPDN